MPKQQKKATPASPSKDKSSVPAIDSSSPDNPFDQASLVEGNPASTQYPSNLNRRGIVHMKVLASHQPNTRMSPHQSTRSLPSGAGSSSIQAMPFAANNPHMAMGVLSLRALQQQQQLQNQLQQQQQAMLFARSMGLQMGAADAPNDPPAAEAPAASDTASGTGTTSSTRNPNLGSLLWATAPSPSAPSSALSRFQQQQESQNMELEHFLRQRAATLQNTPARNAINSQLMNALLMNSMVGQQAAVAAGLGFREDAPYGFHVGVTSPASRSNPVAGEEKQGAAKKEETEEDSTDDDSDFLIPKLPAEPIMPPLEDGSTLHYSKRKPIVPLACDEDVNWLSERQTFIRAQLLEVVRASYQDVQVRSSSKSVSYQQVGIRCRYCAHLHASDRSIRSSAYPSSIRQLYQSFTMMVRDHWVGCKGLPPTLKRRFMAYQEHKIPSSSLSREYWSYAAAKIGMVDTEYGITITEESMKEASKMLSFGTSPEHIKAMQEKEDGEEKSDDTEALIHPDESNLSPYLRLLMSNVTTCELLESERVGKRKAAPVGLSGFGCRHCISRGRLGFCRIFPLNKRSMPTKVNDLYTHFQRCPLTPAPTRATLRKYRKDAIASKPFGRGGVVTTGAFAKQDREFMDQLWRKLGRTGFQI